MSVPDPSSHTVTYDTLTDLTDRFLTTANVQYLNNVSEVNYSNADKMKVYGALTDDLLNSFRSIL